MSKLFSSEQLRRLAKGWLQSVNLEKFVTGVYWWEIEEIMLCVFPHVSHDCEGHGHQHQVV